MELATIEMPVEEAEQAFQEYRTAVRERHDDEDKRIMRGYRALARGQQVLRLSRTIAAGGVDTLTIRKRWSAGTTDVSVPRLAVARANRETVWTFGVNDRGGCVMQTKRDPHINNRFDVMRFADETFPESQSDDWGSVPRIKAVVPIIPPRLRPRTGLGNFHILFEAEWGIDPEPPVDPALLKHIGGDLYAVIATWDLTALERAVLAGR